MITKETVSHLAKLSRLRFSETELETFTHDLGDIFNYATLLNQVDTETISPSSHAIPLQNVMKPDTVETYDSDKIMQNAPVEENHSFKVPRILAD